MKIKITIGMSFLLASLLTLGMKSALASSVNEGDLIIFEEEGRPQTASNVSAHNRSSSEGELLEQVKNSMGNPPEDRFCCIPIKRDRSGRWYITFYDTHGNGHDVFFSNNDN